MPKALMRAWRQPLALSVAAGCLLAAAGCRQLPPEPAAAPPAAMPEIATAPAPIPAVPRPAQKPAPPAAPMPAPAPAAAPATVPMTVPPAPVPVAPDAFDRITGLDQPGTANLFGEPQQRADSPPATIWRYVSRDCELDVYFYLDLKAKEMRALHYEVKSDDPADRSAQRCYDQLVNERRPRLEPVGSSNSSR